MVRFFSFVYWLPWSPPRCFLLSKTAPKKLVILQALMLVMWVESKHPGSTPPPISGCMLSFFLWRHTCSSISLPDIQGSCHVDYQPYRCQLALHSIYLHHAYPSPKHIVDFDIILASFVLSKPQHKEHQCLKLTVTH